MLTEVEVGDSGQRLEAKGLLGTGCFARVVADFAIC